MEQDELIKSFVRNHSKDVNRGYGATDTKSKVLKSLSIPHDYSLETIRIILGNGINVLARDTYRSAYGAAQILGISRKRSGKRFRYWVIEIRFVQLLAV
jgi:hypothetical protein